MPVTTRQPSDPSGETLRVLVPDSLRAFAVFAATLNFTAAAEELRLSQPSLHKQIQRLQSDLGVELYTKNDMQLKLTSAGEGLAQYAGDSIHLARRSLPRITGLEDGPINIAAERAAVLWVTSEALFELARRSGGIKVRPAGRAEAIERIRRGTDDVAVLSYFHPSDDLKYELLASYPLTLVVASDHPLAARGSAAISDLDGMQFAMPARGSAMREDVEHAFRSAGTRLRVQSEADDLDVLVKLVQYGIEAAIVPACTPADANVVQVPIADLRPVPFCAVWRAERDDVVSEFLSAFNR